jgi:nucleoid-associated protein YgaU
VADCRKLARDTRLAAEKMVERRKVEIKEQAVLAARRDLDAHVAALNGELAPMALRPVVADFAGAIKGLRSFASLQDALDTTLAKAKIEADNQARGIRANVAAFKAQAEGMEFLFADLGQIVHKAADDFVAVLQARIATHRAAEAERERKRVEAAAAEAVRVAQQQAQAAQQAAAVPMPAPTPPPAAPAPVARPIAPVPTAADPATLKLGTICDRLGFIVRADFLADTLHIRPASKADGRPGLYTESQFVAICHQLRSHVAAMVELYAGEPA